ncbi:Hint domain-containing protein [Leisingera sp.]|uniref:Hint domain-containing protein n=1 Tax=Leisingera sp. TaxID=1879318 RepID=UPI003A8D0406
MTTIVDEPENGRDGIVEGTGGNDLIDGDYTGDPEGDMVDNGDAIDPAAGPDDDVIEAGSGDDTVYAGSGQDTVYGGSGDDVIHGDGHSGGSNAISVRIDANNGGYVNSVFAYTIDPATGEIGDIVELTASAKDNVGQVFTYHAPEGALVGIGISGPGGTFYSSGYGANASLNSDGLPHTGGFGQNPDGSVSIGFEDMANLGDQDYDDVLLTVDLGTSGARFDNAHYDYASDPEGAVYGGDDSLVGGEGDDTIIAGAGDDTVEGGDGSDSVEGGAGDDVIDTSGGDALPDRGFPGYSGTNPNIPYVPADGDPYDDRDTVIAGAGNDTVTTGDDADVIDGGSGMDVLDGGIDDDSIDGGADDDVLIGGEGSDTLVGGSGNDTIYGGLDPSVSDRLNITDDGSDGRPADPDPTNGRDIIHGGAGDDVIYGQDDDDLIRGGSGNDTIDAGIDDDTVFGGSGDDVIRGGQGDDLLRGGRGNDAIDLGAGDGEDRAYGGVGSDSFTGISAGDVVYGGEDPDGSDNDVLDLTGAAEAQNPGGSLSVTYDASNPENGTVTFFDAEGHATGSAEFYEIERVVVPCFTPGTLIATPDGERRVEELKVGDRVITRDNGIQEIRWIGTRALAAADLADAEHLQPVLIRQGALGNGLPERDMMVSPNHRVLIANDKTALYFEDREVLVAAKHLTGLDGVDQVATSQVTYIHFMFDQHEVVLSDGAWTESFQPGDHSLRGLDNAQRNELFALFPELQSEQGRISYAAARRALRKHEAHLLVH